MEILDTKQIKDKIEVVIKNAQTKIILIIPYMELWDSIIQEINNAISRKVQVIIVHRPLKRHQSQTKLILKQFKSDNVTVLISTNVHAKLYMNEQALIITSMNLYKYSSEHNYEIGFYTNAKKLYQASYQIAQKIIDEGKPETLQTKIMSEVIEQTAQKQQEAVQEKVIYNKMELCGYVDGYKPLPNNA